MAILQFPLPYLQTAEGVPKLCQAIEENLSLSDEERENPLAYFLTTEEFEKWVAEEVGITLSDDEKKVAVEYLDSSGIASNYYLILRVLINNLFRLLILVVEFAFDLFGFVTTSSVHFSHRPILSSPCQPKHQLWHQGKT